MKYYFTKERKYLKSEEKNLIKEEHQVLLTTKLNYWRSSNVLIGTNYNTIQFIKYSFVYEIFRVEASL